MQCPQCKEVNDKVTDTRAGKDFIRRRRECMSCGARFTTREYIEKAEFNIVKRDGRREPFHREKLRAGITKACIKRPVSTEAIDSLLLSVENDLAAMSLSEIQYSVIGNLVMEKLLKLDPVAYVRFASVYKEFQEVGEFVQITNNARSGIISNKPL